jgi:glycosyltransferase involved in cell wall biosynthesis
VWEDAPRRFGAIVHEVPLAKLRGEPAAPWRLARGVAALRRTINNEGVAMIYANSLRASLYALIASRLTRRPLVWHVHDILPAGAYVRELCARCKAVIAVSAAVARPLPRTANVRVIHNPVDLTDFAVDRHEQSARLRATWGIPPHAMLIGQVARLQAWKGQRDVIAAVEELLGTLPDTYCVIVGGDIFGDAHAYEAELKATVAGRNLSDRIIFVGHQDDVFAVFGALDILVHASTDEPFGRVLIEAGAAGLPVVAYGGGGVPEILLHDRTALVVPPGDRAALAVALRRLVDDPALARALGEAGRANVHASFDARRLIPEIEKVLDRAL